LGTSDEGGEGGEGLGVGVHVAQGGAKLLGEGLHESVLVEALGVAVSGKEKLVLK